MGTKFGNVHVLTHDKDNIVSAVRLLTDSKVTRSPKIIDETFETLMIQANQSKNIYFISEVRPGWVSILNDWFGWGEVESFGEKLSSYINAPIITISYFDDDLFELNVFTNGSNTTGQIWCSEETQDTYGIEMKEADISILTSILGHKHLDELNEILRTEDCEEAIEKLQETVQVPLWIHSDWFNDIDDDVKRQYTKYDFNK